MYKVKEMIFISPLRKNILRYGFYLCFIMIALTIFSVPHYLIDRSQRIISKEQKRFQTDLKYILFWKPPTQSKIVHYHPREHEIISGQNVFIKQKCKFINCYVTYDKHLLREDHRNFDGVVFSVHDIASIIPSEVNLTRAPYQRYIFHSLDSAIKYPVCNPAFDGFFNWTWTYKLDSDIVHPFFNVYNSKNKLVGPKKRMKWIAKMTHNDRFAKKIAKKNKAVALLVHQCRLKINYHEYIIDLQKELQGYNYSLDLYGPCGDKKCPNNLITNCYKLIEKKYFFHLILEDSIAEDYATDRILKALTHLSIPIVLGGLDYSSFMPPGSYIISQQFDIKKLGAIIDHLIKNPQIYEYFFDWKNHYYYTPKSRYNLCDLCAKFNSNNSVSVYKRYDMFRSWWNPDFRQKCRKLRYEHLFTGGE